MISSMKIPLCQEPGSSKNKITAGRDGCGVPTRLPRTKSGAPSREFAILMDIDGNEGTKNACLIVENPMEMDDYPLVICYSLRTGSHGHRNS